jgi:hypothetical protein
MPKSVRRPSPALIVAIVALVAALAGSAIALPGKNSVKSNDIAKNAIKSKHVKNNKLTGNDINESTLGTVPSATTATSAGSVAGRTRIAQFVGEGSHDLATFGPFTLVGECVSGGGLGATLQIETSTNDSSLTSEVTEETDFDIADNPVDLLFDLAGADTPDLDSNDAGLLAIGADGTTVTSGDYFVAANVAGHIGECYFGGTFEQLR